MSIRNTRDIADLQKQIADMQKRVEALEKKMTPVYQEGPIIPNDDFGAGGSRRIVREIIDNMSPPVRVKRKYTRRVKTENGPVS